MCLVRFGELNSLNFSTCTPFGDNPPSEYLFEELAGLR